MPTRELSSAATELLRTLKTGDNISQVRNYASPSGLADVAHALLDNAAHLAKNSSSDDFRIFGVLFSIRHALELWAKAFIQHDQLATAKAAIKSGQQFAEIVSALCMDESAKKAIKSIRVGLVATLCRVRNLARGLTFPEFMELEIGEEFCGDALAMLRELGVLNGYRLSSVWAVPVAGHDLQDLWRRAEPTFTDMAYRAREEASMCLDDAAIITATQMAGVFELFGVLDPFGDAFRYPVSLRGVVHRIEDLSLQALERLARELEHTLLAYDEVLESEDA